MSCVEAVLSLRDLVRVEVDLDRNRVADSEPGCVDVPPYGTGWREITVVVQNTSIVA